MAGRDRGGRRGVDSKFAQAADSCRGDRAAAGRLGQQAFGEHGPQQRDACPSGQVTVADPGEPDRLARPGLAQRAHRGWRRQHRQRFHRPGQCEVDDEAATLYIINIGIMS
jgi:hypothetical protein